MPHDILITQAVFDEKLVDEKRTTIKVHVYPQEDDEEDEEDEEAATEDQKETLVLAHLLPGRVGGFLFYTTVTVLIFSSPFIVLD